MTSVAALGWSAAPGWSASVGWAAGAGWSMVVSAASTGLALLAVALLLWPSSSAPSSPSPSPSPPSPANGNSQTGRPAAGVTQDVVTAGAVGVLAALTFGPVRGSLVAAAAIPAALGGIRWLRRRPAPARTDPRLPLVLDLVAAALHAGQPVSRALRLAVPVAGEPTGQELITVATLLELGADPSSAWRAHPDPAGGAARPSTASPAIAVLGPVAVRSSTSGIRLAASFERLADELRAEALTAGAVRAQRAGVLAMGPLAACFLPSFVCLGIVPVVVGMAGTVLPSVR